MESTQSLSALSAPSAALSPEKKVLAWYDAFADDMLRFCFLCLGSQQEGEKALCEAFLRLMKNSSASQEYPFSSPRTLCLRSACIVCKKSLRRFRRFYPADDAALSAQLAAFGCTQPDDLNLLSGIMHLPFTERCILLMTCWLGLSEEETAFVMHLRLAALRKHRVLAEELLTKSGRKEKEYDEHTT